MPLRRPRPRFRHVPEAHTAELTGLEYVVQVAPDDCTGCGLCVEVCPAKDRSPTASARPSTCRPSTSTAQAERANWVAFTS